MRHTFVTLMIEHSEDILWVSNMLGHADASITLQMYAKYRKREEIKRASFLGSILGHNWAQLTNKSSECLYFRGL